MTTVEQIKRGLARYLDSEFTARMSGWQKWVFGAGAALAIDNADAMIDRLKDDPIISQLGIMGTDGEVDIDLCYRYLRKEAEKGKATFQLPLVGVTTLSHEDIDKLYQCIRQA